MRPGDTMERIREADGSGRIRLSANDATSLTIATLIDDIILNPFHSATVIVSLYLFADPLSSL